MLHCAHDGTARSGGTSHTFSLVILCSQPVMGRAISGSDETDGFSISLVADELQGPVQHEMIGCILEQVFRHVDRAHL